MAVTWANFQISGKKPISNKLLKSLDSENETGVAISLSIFPGIPQWEKLDFFIVLISFATSRGLVFNNVKLGTPIYCSKFGIGSSLLGTVDFDVKYLLSILLLSILNGWYFGET